MDSGLTQGPEPRVDAEVGRRLDLAHRPGGGLGGRLHAAGREVVDLRCWGLRYACLVFSGVWREMSLES